MALWAQPQGCVGHRSAFGLCSLARNSLVPCVRRLSYEAQAARPCRRRRELCMDAPQATAVTDIVSARPGVWASSRSMLVQLACSEYVY